LFSPLSVALRSPSMVYFSHPGQDFLVRFQFYLCPMNRCGSHFFSRSFLRRSPLPSKVWYLWIRSRHSSFPFIDITLWLIFTSFFFFFMWSFRPSSAPRVTKKILFDSLLIYAVLTPPPHEKVPHFCYSLRKAGFTLATRPVPLVSCRPFPALIT